MLDASNRVGPAGAEGVAAALAKTPALRELHFSGNALGDMGVSNLVAGAVRGRGLKGDPQIRPIGDRKIECFGTLEKPGRKQVASWSCRMKPIGEVLTSPNRHSKGLRFENMSLTLFLPFFFTRVVREWLRRG